MTLSRITKFSFATIVAIGLAGTAPAFAQSEGASQKGLAAANLAGGETLKAIEALEAQLKEYPRDPALMINLGIAYAHTGNDAEARTQFEAAMESRKVVELDTADGRTTSSRRLARQAISMLERGEFRPSPRQTDQLTLRN